MTHLAARLLPHAAGQAGMTDPADVRLVLTGPGGGTWDMTAGRARPSWPPSRSSPTRSGPAGWRDRVAPAGLDVFVAGDPACAAEVLAAATLALD